MTQANSEYVESILKKYDFKKIRRSRGGFNACCKFHEESNPSFSISDSGLWICFGCGEKGNLKSLVRRLGGDLSDWREGLKLAGVQLSGTSLIAKSGKPGVLPSDFKTYSEMGHCSPAMMKRLDWQTIAHFNLGEANSGRNANRCIIPIYYRTRVVGYHGRAYDDATLPKYYNSPGVDIKEYVFNFDSCEPGGEVIIVEGAFNAMSMWEKGFENTVATFGTKFTASQVQRIFSLSPESIVICYDRDENKAGQIAAMKLGALTYQLVDTYIMPMPIGKDPNDLDASTLEKCYNKRIKYDDFIQRRKDSSGR
jgi:DNA primase